MSETPIFELYESLKLWSNPICMKCRSSAKTDLCGPVGIWQLGDDFFNDPNRLVFIGKTARGDLHNEAEQQLKSRGFIDGTEKADLWIEEKWSAYWHYTAAIIEKLYGSIEIGWKKIAFTNLVKCNNSMDIDNTTHETSNYCLNELGVVWKELKIIKPKNIVIFSHDQYDRYIETFLSNFHHVEIEDKGKNFRIEVGKKQILWWEQECMDEEGWKFRILRTSHPERKKKDIFVEKIANWVKIGVQNA